MRVFPKALSLIAILSPASLSADCASEIAALFDGGAWDPFVRENRREITIARTPSGAETPVSDVLWDGPLNSINCIPSGCYMAIGFQSYSGTSFDGPWTKGGPTGSGDPAAFVQGTNDRLAQSVSQPECLGETDLDGQSAVQYRFLSKPEPNDYGAWWGGTYTVWVDPAASRILRIELANGIASWAPKPSENLQITTITYDPDIKVKAPE